MYDGLKHKKLLQM